MSTRNFNSDPERPSFLEELYQGRFRWDLIKDFPVQGTSDTEKGDRLLAELDILLTARVDGDQVDAESQLPVGLLEELATRGFFRLQSPEELGGHALSHYNTFRVVVAAARHSTPVALSIAIENALGASAFLHVMAEGPLRELVREHVARGKFSASADSEPSGAANRGRQTRAEKVPGQDLYVLNGRKVFVGHAPIAELVSVTATVHEDGGERVAMFFVHTDSPGVRHGQWHEYMGIRGFPNGWLEFENVLVPAEQRLGEKKTQHQIRTTPAAVHLVGRGRLHLIAAPALAVANLSLEWSRDFVHRRVIDGRTLSDYDEIQRLVARSRAETFAIETVSQWSLLPADQGRAVNLLFEQNIAKNAASLLAWDIVDRTLSLLAAEGYETARSKNKRGVPGVPVERYFRDTRNLRVSGGVDFQLDNWVARMSILSYYYPEPEHAEELLAEHGAPEAGGTALSARNRDHLQAVATEIHRFGRTCLLLVRAHPDREVLQEREHLLILLTRIARELLLMALTLARASALAETGDHSGQGLADVFCFHARQRVAELHAQLDAGPEPDFAAVSDELVRPRTSV